MPRAPLVKRVRVGLVALLAGLLLVGCGGEPPGTNTPVAGTPGASATPTENPATPPGTSPVAATWPPEADAAVVNAKQDLAKTTSVAESAITVVSVTPQDWPTSGLGCEQPGHAYLQVITPGYLIVLDAGGTQYTYHASKAGEVVNCSPSVTPTPATQTDQLPMYAAAIATFFHSPEVLGYLEPQVLTRKVVYIRPTFDRTQHPVPAAIVELVVAQTTALGLVQVPAEEPGGAVVSIGVVGRDAESTRLVYGRDGPTLPLGLYVSGVACGGSIGVGYLLTPTDTGWKAESYVTGVC